MATYTIKQRVDYYAEIEADSEEEAMKIYLDDQDAYYDGVWSETITREENDND
jgi:hypothetical protein